MQKNTPITVFSSEDQVMNLEHLQFVAEIGLQFLSKTNRPSSRSGGRSPY